MPSTPELAALVTAICFAAGLNVYATVVSLGLLGRFGWIELPGQLGLLTNEWIIGACAVLWAFEFVADKIPVFDLFWNVLQTFVRVPVGALLAYAATPSLDPFWQLVAATAGGGLALAAHSGKIAARTAVTSSPEPFSNLFLSLIEDALAIFVVWFATEHPYLAAIIALAFVALVIVLIRLVYRAVRAMFRNLAARMRSSEPATT
jgi:Flp pilus assembly pilin Flp